MVTPRIALVRAPNPSAMTLTGTNSYVIDCGGGEALCIDPGPAIERHVEALQKQAERMRCRIATIALTHTHPDHAPAAPVLAARTGAPIAANAQSEFRHDTGLRDGSEIRAGTSIVDVIAAPGHTFDHLVFYDRADKALFTGDTVLGEGYVVIAPPNGAMRPYQATLRRLLDEFAQARILLGGHGEPVLDPQKKLREYLAHRIAREGEILAALQDGERTIPQLVQHIYRETPPVLWPAAARQMLAYLIALEQEGRVTSLGLPRDMTPEEHAILNPEWETIVGAEHARTVEEELGAMLRLDTIRSYSLS